MSTYEQFLAVKAQEHPSAGFHPTFLPPALIDFQGDLVEWSVRRGRSAIFADCGLGKTLMELVWAENVHRHTNRPVILFDPPAVARQTVREAAKFDIEVHLSTDGKVRPGINIANYERIHYFDPNDFAGMVGDESGILKSFDGTRRHQITEFLRKMPYRLLATATPSPNEYPELGTHAEALGHLGYMDMLARFFKNDQGNSIKPQVYRHGGKNFTKLDDNAKWRFKGHAEQPFWRWVCSWARAVRKPSDLGFDDGRFVLPSLTERQHLVDVEALPSGKLFALPAVGLSEQREERRRSICERCEAAAALVSNTCHPYAIWCDLNAEGDLLETLLGKDCVQVSGDDSEDAKEEKFLAFIDGQVRGLVTKDKIGAWGLNFQHCNHLVSFPTHSFEGYYQRVRRFWRFGQTRPVTSDIVTTEGEKNVLDNLQRKSVAADRMFAALVASMNDAASVDRSLKFNDQTQVPSWL